jgi:hypothetical protein
MLALRLVRLIESHADQLSREFIQRLKHDSRSSDLEKIPQEELIQRSYDVYRHLSEWVLQKSEHELKHTYRELGVRRAAQGVALSQVLWAILSTKELLWKFLQDESVVTSPVELYGEMELFRLVDQFFDKALYYMATGYEHARVAGPAVVA